jgi:hypothetical protein
VNRLSDVMMKSITFIEIDVLLLAFVSSLSSFVSIVLIFKQLSSVSAIQSMIIMKRTNETSVSNIDPIDIMISVRCRRIENCSNSYMCR